MIKPVINVQAQQTTGEFGARHWGHF